MSKKCLFHICEKPSDHRGLCHTHYITASKLVRDGKITWEELVAAGKAAEISSGSGITAWLLEAKQKGNGAK